MLVRFLVENYRSFKERQVFSMAAGKHTRHKEQIVFINGKRLLKAGILFGANAAGKSNLIKAIFILSPPLSVLTCFVKIDKGKWNLVR